MLPMSTGAVGARTRRVAHIVRHVAGFSPWCCRVALGAHPVSSRLLPASVLHTVFRPPTSRVRDVQSSRAFVLQRLCGTRSSAPMKTCADSIMARKWLVSSRTSIRKGVSRRIALNVLAAIAIPFVLETLFILVARSIGPRAPFYDNFSSQVISTVVGFVFIVRAIGIYSLVGGLVYLPVMFYTLIGFALWFNGVAYGDWL